MPIVHIDSSRCCGDALCVRVCPASCLRMKGGLAALAPLGEQRCLACGQCVAVCPRAAVTLDGDGGVEMQEGFRIPSPDEVASLVKSRRSVRDFKNLPVPRDLLEKALETARYAPTGKNRQDVAWTALDDPGKLRELSGLVVEAMRGMEGAQRLAHAFDRGEDPILRGAPCAIFAHASEQYSLSPADCALAVGYLDLALHSSGLAACWAGYAIRMAQLDPAVQKFLAIPEDRKVYGGLMIGYPAVRYRRIPSRKPVRAIWL